MTKYALLIYTPTTAEDYAAAAKAAAHEAAARGGWVEYTRSAVPDLDAALDWAARMPVDGATIEVRAMSGMPWQQMLG
jgi:hypothetical protein